MSGIARIDEQSVRKAYARWAPIYDLSFGAFADAGRKCAVAHINKGQGTVLEVGVGTGISLPGYGKHLKITGIDLSTDMLAKARERVRTQKLANVVAVEEMDASDLRFADGAFDTVVAMYVMTVVPDPVKVLSELERVCAPGGEVLILNHFAQDHGLRGAIERWMAPAARALGWHPDFRIETITDMTKLDLVETRSLQPMGLFTLLRFRKPGAEAAAPASAAANL